MSKHRKQSKTKTKSILLFDEGTKKPTQKINLQPEFESVK